MTDDVATVKRIVEEGYDRVALRYAQLEGEETWPRMRWATRVLAELADGASVLDLGCGGGVPVGPEVVKRHRFTGVDISAAQVELARGTFRRGSSSTRT
jgi:ubiquinone/menaquinone biosynthesis C-methylase UbiE